MISSEEHYVININLNINLNGISNDNDEIGILGEPKSLSKSRSLSGNAEALPLSNPLFPLPLRGKQLNILCYLKNIDGNMT